MTAAAPPALFAAGRAARFRPAGALSSSRPSSSPLLPAAAAAAAPGRSRFLPAGPPRFLGPARAVPLPEPRPSQAAAAFFLGMVALEETRGSGAQWTGYKTRGEGSHDSRGLHFLPARPEVAATGRAERGRAPEEIAPPPGIPGAQVPDCNPLKERTNKWEAPKAHLASFAHIAS